MHVRNALPAYFDEAPDYAIRAGQMYVTLRGFVLVMPVSIFMEGMVRAEAEIARWHLAEMAKQDDNVVRLGLRG